jgi:hypothetical protein
MVGQTGFFFGAGGAQRSRPPGFGSQRFGHFGRTMPWGPRSHLYQENEMENAKDKVKDAAHTAAEAAKNAAKKVADASKTVVNKAGEKVEHAGQKMKDAGK